MGYLGVEVQAEAQRLGIVVEQVSAPDMLRVRGSVYARYSSGNPTFSKPLSELLEGCESIHDPEGWRLLGDLLGQREAILFFDQHIDPVGIRISDGYSLQKVIGECTGFVFYVTDQESTFLISFTDHDMVLASGALSERLRQITRQ